ncbi:MAG: helix-turn-helix transcriptional regulator [Nitrospirae bacterium]|nr:helix-turn-helix transcriptional regulator [Nitrospirota bacterium]
MFFREDLKKRLKNTEFRKAYEEADAEVRLAVKVAEAREAAGLSQAELASAIHTKQSNISRIERGAQNVTIGTLSKIAKVLHCRLEIQIRHA